MRLALFSFRDVIGDRRSGGRPRVRSDDAYADEGDQRRERAIGLSAVTNWAGNHRYRATRLAQPTTVGELQAMVAGAPRVKALGTRHSFNDVADTDGILLRTDRLPGGVEIDSASRVASVAGGQSYGALATELHRHGWALATLASLPHISVAGAVSTGTHGSGDRTPSLAAAVRALDLVGADGEIRTLRRGQPEFDGSVVALGALGVVVRLELDIEPGYEVAQTVYPGLPWSVVEAHLSDLTALGYSVSLFTRFDAEGVRQLWVKRRLDAPSRPLLPGLVPATGPVHMLDGASTDAVTPQAGAAGPWLDRLPHFRLGFTPSRGEELQSEYLLPRARADAAIHALRGLAGRFGHLLQIAEIRTVAADDLWLSGAYGRDVVALHFTWVPDHPAVLAALAVIEDALLPLGGRPHWGKVFRAGAAELGEANPRLGDFRDLRDRVDPGRKFGNAFLDRVLGGGDT